MTQPSGVTNQSPLSLTKADSRPPARVGGGRWYFVLTVLSAGFLAAVPFWHAWSRLRRPGVRTMALIYTAIDVYLVVLMAITPEPNPDGSSGNSAISTIGGFSVCAVVVVACIQLRSLRRAAYATPRVLPAESDLMLALAVAARERREKARTMWARILLSPASSASDAPTWAAASTTVGWWT